MSQSRACFEFNIVNRSVDHHIFVHRAQKHDLLTWLFSGMFHCCWYFETGHFVQVRHTDDNNLGALLITGSSIHYVMSGKCWQSIIPILRGWLFSRPKLQDIVLHFYDAVIKVVVMSHCLWLRAQRRAARAMRL